MKSNYAIILIGLPGVGKTTVANYINEQLNWFYCSSDFIRSRLFCEESIEQDRDYTIDELKIIYNGINLLVDVQTQNKKNMIIDGVFRTKACRDSVVDILTKSGYSVFKYCLYCQEEVALARVCERKQKTTTTSPAGVSGYAKIQAEFETPSECEGFACVDNSVSSSITAISILETLKQLNVS